MINKRAASLIFVLGLLTSVNTAALSCAQPQPKEVVLGLLVDVSNFALSYAFPYVAIVLLFLLGKSLYTNKTIKSFWFYIICSMYLVALLLVTRVIDPTHLFEVEKTVSIPKKTDALLPPIWSCPHFALSVWEFLLLIVPLGLYLTVIVLSFFRIQKLKKRVK